MSKHESNGLRKAAIKKTKQYSKTIETLSRMAEEVGDTDDNESQDKKRTRFGGIKHIKLTDFGPLSDNETSSKDESSVTSIYMGAGLKLDAFDCFHKSLNKCVSDYTFSVSDAAYFLKQLSPSIIKRIVPIITQQTQLISHKTNNTDLNDGDGSIDLEVSELTKKPKSSQKTGKLKNSIKRPDASRPTRMLSPGSNSCSPVSAAVQALISISAPVTNQTNSITNSSPKEKPVKSADSGQKSTTFVPLSKPSTSVRDFNSDNVFLPVHKPEAVSSDFSKDISVLNSTSPDQEVSEVMSVQRKVGIHHVYPKVLMILHLQM